MFAPFPTTLDQLADLLNRAKTPLDVFGHDTLKQYCRLAKLCHPDLFLPGAEQDKAARIFRRLTELRDAALQSATLQSILSPTRKYETLEQLATGDLADVHLAVADGKHYVLKIPRPVAGNPLMAAEARHLKTLTTRCGDRRYREYLPKLIETFTVPSATGDRQANVFAHRDGFYTLEAIRRQHPAGLDARHLAWIFKRLLTVIGFAQTCGLVHGAVLPPHVMLHADNHGLQLLDWIHAVRTDSLQTFIPTTYRDWYPAEILRRELAGPSTDIFLAAKCILYAAGGDPITGCWPNTIPAPIQRFIDTCLFAAPRMRPQSAWDLHEEFDELLGQLFGPPKYHRLVMS
jgi:hypothetical protein